MNFNFYETSLNIQNGECKYDSKELKCPRI